MRLQFAIHPTKRTNKGYDFTPWATRTRIIHIFARPRYLHLHFFNSSTRVRHRAWVEGWDAIEVPILKVYDKQGCWPTTPDAPSQGRMKWNEWDESVEKWCNEICGGGKREKPREKPIQTPFRPPRNPNGVTERWTRDPSGGRLESNRLCHLHFQSEERILSNINKNSISQDWDRTQSPFSKMHLKCLIINWILRKRYQIFFHAVEDEKDCCSC